MCNLKNRVMFGLLTNRPSVLKFLNVSKDDTLSKRALLQAWAVRKPKKVRLPS